MSRLKYLLYIFSLLIFFKIDAQQQKASTKSKNVMLLKKEFLIKNLNDIPHKVWIYLPPDYHESEKNYPVIYMQDGQNLFDDITSFVGEWKVDETLNELYEKTSNSFIVVGIENGGEERINEYTPWQHKKYGGGKGSIYIDFIVNTLKPYIDKKYRTRTEPEFTGLIGSSLGGLISYYGGLKHPTTFGKIGALSTSFWFSDKVIDFTKKYGNLKNTKLYLLVGEKEGDSMVPDTKNMTILLKKIGFEKENLKTKIVPEGKHNESLWSSEFLDVISFLYNF